MMKRILTVLAAVALATPAMIAPAIFSPAAAQASLNIGLSVPGTAMPMPMFGVAPGPVYASGYGYNRWAHREWEHRHWREERYHGHEHYYR